MSKYLLEIGTEELPYKFIPQAINQLRMGFENFLNSNKVDFEKIDVYATQEGWLLLFQDLLKKVLMKKKL